MTSNASSHLAARLQVIQDNESIIFMPPFSDVVSDPRYQFLAVEDAYEVEIGIIYDRAELDAQNIELLVSPIIEAYRSFEEAGLCTITFSRPAQT